MPDRTSRDLTPVDLRLLEPDLLGAIGFALYGRGAPPKRPPRDRKRQRSAPPDGAER